MKIGFLILGVGGLALVGCGSETPQATAEQNKAFAGGPMPADWKAKMSSAQSAKGQTKKPK